MTIRIEAYDRLPDAARAIREQVFIRERDWRPEFDEWDAVSVHLLAFDSNDAPNRPGLSAQSASSIQSGQPDQNRPVATCRFYADPDHPDQPGRYVIARLAVLTEAQGRHIGSRLLSDAERRIAQAGGTMAAVHSENDHYSSTNSAATGSLTRSMKAVVTAGWSRTYLVTYEGPPRCWASEPTARRQSDKSPRRGRRIR